MKKKSILLLLVAFTLSLVFGLVGCTTVSEGEGVKLSNETTYSLIKDLNDGRELITKLDSYAIVYDFEGGETDGYHAEYFYTNDNEKYFADYSLVDNNGKLLAATNVRDGASYTLTADGEYVFSIYPEKDFSQQVFNIGLISFDDQVLNGTIMFAGDTLRFSTVQMDEGYPRVSYEWEVDYQTLLINNLKRCVEDEEGNVETATIAFAYNDANYTPNLTAYEKITDANANQRQFVVMFNPEGYEYEYERVFSVAAGTKVVMDVAADGTKYSLYENIKCTRNIEDLGEYIVYYDNLGVYASKAEEEISLKFTLSDADVEEMEMLLDTFFAYVEDGYSIDQIETIRSFIEDKMSYFVHMYYMGQVEYYRDITKASGQEAMTYAQSVYNDMYDAYIGAYKFVYQMDDDVEYKQYLFEGWTEEDFAIFEQDNEAISELEEANAQLEMEFNALRENDAEWSYKVEVIYEQMVANNQELARLNGYDDAYDYLSATAYSRFYSDEERAGFSQAIKEYIVGYYNTALAAWQELNGTLTNNDITRYNAATRNGLKSLDNEYIGGYINSFSNGLEVKMSNMYEKNAIVFASSNNSQGTAFAQYSGYYGEGFTFFGKENQELMTIIHEMGHYTSFYEYSLGSMGYDLAETHSQGNEWLFLAYLENNMQKKTYNIAKTLRLVNGFSTILYSAIVDEFEYRVYKAENPITAGNFRAVMKEALDFLGIMSTDSNVRQYYDGYAQIVTVLSPVYYLNYATSEIAAMGFYSIAKLEGYEQAQEVYRRLQEDCDITKPYGQILKDIGLNSPFEEETYIALGEAFFA